MVFLKKKKSWCISENEVTDECSFHNRRKFLKTLSYLSILPVTLSFSKDVLSSQNYNYSSKINKKYVLDREITDEKLATTYTNFYEFGSSKNIWRRASKLKIDPWDITINGLVDKPIKLDIKKLKKLLGYEERIYRFRCVEAWSMTVPWLGFPFEKIINLVQPTKDAKFVKFETFYDPNVAPGQKQNWYPWPYEEGITIDEAKNDLTFLATGMYGKDLPNQNGAPLRLVLPWKYGFKSIKSIVGIRFVKNRPIGLWEKLAPKEYGFWANVNPDVSHPRWSQEFEKILGYSHVRKTEIFNGYEEQVSYLYKNIHKNDNVMLFK